MTQNLNQEEPNNLQQEEVCVKNLENTINQLYDFKNIEILDDVDCNDDELECTDGSFDFEDNQHYKE
jgi:hypothetical protein